MLRCLIVDDEAYARGELTCLLRDFEEIEIVGEASHGYEAIEKNRELKPDLIFLDIRMPQIGGIEVADIIINEEKVPLIVFITAYEEYAIKAFEVNAVDYLLKPISKSRLNQTIKRAMELCRDNDEDYIQGIKRLLIHFKANKKEEAAKLYINEKGRLIILEPFEIIYATIEDGNISVITIRGKFKSRITLNQLEEQLNSNIFFRSHKSYLINLDYIEGIIPWHNSTYAVELKNVEEKVPISRNKLKEFKTIMNM